MTRIQSFKLDEALEILERTPATVRAMLGGLSEGWAHGDYGRDTFSPFDVIGHLIHGERTDWIPRVQIILEHGTGKTFEPFDRFAMRHETQGRTTAQLLDEFQRLRESNLRTLRAMRLSEEDLARRGAHPELGTVTLGQMLATWAVHDLNHVRQICKAMSHQYRGFVGPWKPYLAILSE